MQRLPFFTQWQRGIETAKNEWIWIAESDDFADPGFLEEAAKAIQEHASIGLFLLRWRNLGKTKTDLI